MNTKLDKEYFKSIINKVVVLTYKRNIRPDDDYTTCVVSVQDVDDKHNIVMFGHEYNLKTKNVTCGRLGLSLDDDITISDVTQAQFDAWKANYELFHLEVMYNKGYDSCEENIEKLYI